MSSLKNKNLDKLDDFKAMIKTYTSDACYRNIKTYVRESQFEMIKNYLLVSLQGLNEYSEQLSFKNVTKPVWRGLRAEAVQSLDDYELGSIGYWP